ncbi:hypothetical protein AAHA92_09746 [Salvia divinorum]|uniref:Uncharacterized protein n=1 Tax=Salvia divinorum TaxID=28513 RepID=A0ABD1HSK1_SALDI
MDFCKKISKVTHSVGRFWRDLVQLEKVIWVSSLVRKWSKDQLSPMKGKVLEKKPDCAMGRTSNDWAQERSDYNFFVV